MESINRAIKASRRTIVIDEKVLHNAHVLYQSVTQKNEVTFRVGDYGRVKLDILITVCKNCNLYIRISRHNGGKGEGFPINFGGRIHFVEGNRYATLKGAKFCVHPCGSPCRIEGVTDTISVDLDVGNDIPHTATIMLELEFRPMDHESGWIMNPAALDEKSNLKRDMAALKKNTETADVKIICDGKDFWAHKAILSARSDVFAAMFSHRDTAEDKSGEIHIKDCGNEVMDMFLSYMYEDATPSPDTTFEVAKQLMNVANKYNVQPLKNECSEIIIDHINEDNAIEVALMGDLYNMDTLDKAARETIATSNMSLVTMMKNSGLKI